MQKSEKIISRSLIRFICTVLAVFTAFCSFSAAANAESISDVPYESYTYWEGYSSKKAVQTKASYEVRDVLRGEEQGIGSYKELQHMFSYGGYLYVLDSGNGRLLKYDKNYKLAEQIKSFDYNGKKLTFEGAKGLFVDESGLYIADTLNKRILCTKGGKVFNIIERPNDFAIPKTFDYAPTKMVRDSSGYMYVLCEGSYYGMMVFSSDYEFFGFFGANNVKSSVTDAIKSAITSLFETEEKHSSSMQKLPYSLLDICVDKDGFVSAVNSSGSGQIRTYGLTGVNTMKKTDGNTASSADGYNFADNPISFVDKTSRYKTYVSSSMTAIAADDYGYYYVVDSMHGRVFVYDKKCTPITVFGGGKQNGTQTGTFVSPSSVVSFGDDLLVSDFSNNTITVFRLTDYGKMLRTANTLTLESKYIDAKPYWQSVYEQDKNCQLAYRGLAKAALKEKDYDCAMRFAKLGLDVETYSKAFENVRNDFVYSNFWWILPLIVIILGALIALFIICKSRQVVFIKSDRIRTALTVSIHPFESFKNIKYKGLGSPLIATIMLALFYVTSVMQKTLSGFAFGVVDLSSFNSLLLLLGSAGIVLLWTVANWLICTLFSGKGRINEIYCATCYSLTPMLVYNILYIIMSNFMVSENGSSLSLLSTVCYLFTAVLLLLSITVIHDFSFFKAIGMSILIILAMAVVAFVLFSMLTLWQDMLGFVIGVFNEITLR